MRIKLDLLKPKPPVSVGLLLGYRCNASCSYCIYACSPKWSNDWIDISDAEVIFENLARIYSEVYPRLKDHPKNGPGVISFGYGLHFTGGEPFLNYKLLLELTKLALKFKIPFPFVETNCFWVKDDETSEKKMRVLKDAGLAGLLVSVNPFILESVPFERIDRAARIGHAVFKGNLTVYQDFYLSLFRSMGLEGKISFSGLLKKIDIKDFSSYIELLPMGRTPYSLGTLFKKYPADLFLEQNCYTELTENWHNHIDNYCNYIPRFCAGISLGDFRQYDSIFMNGIDLARRPVLKALATGLSSLLELGKKFGYRENENGYISKCHLCIDIRMRLIKETDEFKELAPVQFYDNLK